MKILSDKLALVLAEYSELPEGIKKCIDYYKENPTQINFRGDYRSFECDKKYLYVEPDLFKNPQCLLKSVYGNRIDRTNEDSFDTLLYWYFQSLNKAHVNFNLSLLEKYIEGIEEYAVINTIENTWHILNLSIQCINDSFRPNFSALLSFYALIELLCLVDKRNSRDKNDTIVAECGRKLPYFYHKNLDSLDVLIFKSSLNDKDTFEKLTQLRHKVIHGIFTKARDILNELYPQAPGHYSGNTEDAESSAFQDQIQNVNGLIRSVLSSVLLEWMKNPKGLSAIKYDTNFHI